jgi:hypothetical protein
MATRKKAPANLAEYAKKQQAKALEAQVAKELQKFMALHGWRRFRMTSGLFTAPSGCPVRVGEPGIPDLLFVRYVRRETATFGASVASGVAYLLWVETKRAKGGKKAEEQAEWHRDEEILGGLVYTCSDLDDFRDWYFKRFGFLHKHENLFLAAGVGR